MDKFTVIKIFMTLLKKAKYKNEKAFAQDNFEETLTILEKDREKIFQAMYGEKMIMRGTSTAKEWAYRLMEAEKDIKMKYIRTTMHYLLTQIRIGDLKI